jgi:hypothetical protein
MSIDRVAVLGYRKYVAVKSRLTETLEHPTPQTLAPLRHADDGDRPWLKQRSESVWRFGA